MASEGVVRRVVHFNFIIQNIMIETFKIILSPSVALWSLVGVDNVRPASAPPGILADERRQNCVLPVARPARLYVFVRILADTCKLSKSRGLLERQERCYLRGSLREVPCFGQTAQSWYHQAMAVG